MANKIVHLTLIALISLQISKLYGEECQYEEEKTCFCNDVQISKIVTKNNCDTIKLYYVNHSITELNNYDIAKLNATTFTFINLTYNNIYKIDNICENSTYNITNLILSNNNIKDIPVNMATCIKALRLDNNGIVIPEQKPLLKSNFLSSLYIMNCSIETLYEETFQDLTSLEILDISGNKLQRLPELKIPNLQLNISFMNKICQDKMNPITVHNPNFRFEVKDNNWDCPKSNDIENSTTTTAKPSSKEKDPLFMTFAWLFFGTVIFIQILIFLLFVYLYYKDKKEK